MIFRSARRPSRSGCISESRRTLDTLKFYFLASLRRTLRFVLHKKFPVSQAIAQSFSSTYSQLDQDLLAAALAGGKKDGFFVEFGATNGLLHSNTANLERHLSWKGILAEPCRAWHHSLKSNRTGAIDLRAVYEKSGEEVEFFESETPELSSIQGFGGVSETGSPAISYFVETISLNDLLETWNAPKFIDYLSIDTEGGELGILSAFDFSKHSFGLVSVEHNFSSDRKAIIRLMRKNGYFRILKHHSRWEDWFVPASTFHKV